MRILLLRGFWGILLWFSLQGQLGLARARPPQHVCKPHGFETMEISYMAFRGDGIGKCDNIDVDNIVGR